MKQCPFCAEDIKVEALKCKHCGSAVLSGVTGPSATAALVPLHSNVLSTQGRTFNGSRWIALLNNRFRPWVLTLAQDGVVVRYEQPGLFRKVVEEHVPYAHISSIHIRSGWIFTDIAIQPSGGSTLVAKGFSKRDARDVQMVVRQRQNIHR